MAAASTAIASSALSADHMTGANDRVRLGFIGLGNRGDQVLSAFLSHKDAEVVATDGNVLRSLVQPQRRVDHERVLRREPRIVVLESEDLFAARRRRVHGVPAMSAP